MKKIFAIILFSITLTSFAQKEVKAPLYSFAGHTGDCSITWNEYSKSKKELTPIDSSITIKSFNVSTYINPSYADYSCKGNLFSKAVIELIDKLQQDKKSHKILIERVIADHNGREEQLSSMVITLK